MSLISIIGLFASIIGIILLFVLQIKTWKKVLILIVSLGITVFVLSQEKEGTASYSEFNSLVYAEFLEDTDWLVLGEKYQLAYFIKAQGDKYLIQIKATYTEGYDGDGVMEHFVPNIIPCDSDLPVGGDLIFSAFYNGDLILLIQSDCGPDLESYLYKVDVAKGVIWSTPVSISILANSIIESNSIYLIADYGVNKHNLSNGNLEWLVDFVGGDCELVSENLNEIKIRFKPHMDDPFKTLIINKSTGRTR